LPQDKHDQARALTEQALEALDTGCESHADKLIEKSKKLDPSGAAEVVAERDEDAARSGRQ